MSKKASDYKCPHCRRVRTRPGVKPKISLFCGCTGKLMEMDRISWAKADWKYANKPLADLLDVAEHVVANKRRVLKKPRGTMGRKPRDISSYHRKADAADIDPAKSVQENATALGISSARVRQILSEKGECHAKA